MVMVIRHDTDCVDIYSVCPPEVVDMFPGEDPSLVRVGLPHAGREHRQVLVHQVGELWQWRS